MKNSRGIRQWSEDHGVPLRTILASIGAVVATYLVAITLYHLRSLLVLLLVGAFIAVLLNPIVGFFHVRLRMRRGFAVTVVALLLVAFFGGLAFAFGYPLARGVTHLANSLPSIVHDAEHGRGWIGQLLRKYHAANWVKNNSDKLVQVGRNLSRPALALGRGALSLLLELLTILAFVILLLLEAPKIRDYVLSHVEERNARRLTRLGNRVAQAATGYMAGNLATSAIAGVVTFIPLWLLHVPFAGLFALWVGLVDFLPQIGGALAGIPTVAFAFGHSTTAGVVTFIVFMAYTQIENHLLNPIIMSKTTKLNPLTVFIAVILGAEIGSWVGGLFGGLVGVLLAIPAAATVQAVAHELREDDDTLLP